MSQFRAQPPIEDRIASLHRGWCILSMTTSLVLAATLHSPNPGFSGGRRMLNARRVGFVRGLRRGTAGLNLFAIHLLA